MDYEHRIKLLEEELRHEQALAELRAQRLDAHDSSFDSIREILAQTASAQAKTESLVNQLTVDVAKLEVVVRGLIEAITAERSNGKN
jgi:hypothetical protein